MSKPAATKQLSADQLRVIEAHREKLKNTRAKLERVRAAEDSAERTDAIQRGERHEQELKEQIKILEANGNA